MKNNQRDIFENESRKLTRLVVEIDKDGRLRVATKGLDQNFKVSLNEVPVLRFADQAIRQEADILNLAEQYAYKLEENIEEGPIAIYVFRINRNGIMMEASEIAVEEFVSNERDILKIQNFVDLVCNRIDVMVQTIVAVLFRESLNREKENKDVKERRNISEDKSCAIYM